MAGRLPFNMQGQGGQNPLHDAQIRAALGLSQVDEALYLQQQRELQRDFQLRQMLLQEQLDQQSRLDSLVAEQRLKQIRESLQEYPELQSHYSQLLLHDRLQREQEAETTLLARAQMQREQELRNRAFVQTQAQVQQQSSATTAAGPQPPLTTSQSPVSSPTTKPSNVQPTTAHSLLRDIAADSLAGNAVKRSELERRVFARGIDDLASSKKRLRSNTEDSAEGGKKKKKPKEKPSKKTEEALAALTELGKRTPISEPTKDTVMKPSAQALLDFASSNGKPPSAACKQAPEESKVSLGTLDDLLTAADSEKKTDEAVSVLTGIKKHAEWSDSEKEDQSKVEQQLAIKKGDTIVLPNFKSILPQLPQEPQVTLPSPSKKKRRRHKGLLDEDRTDCKSNGKTKLEKKETKETITQSKSAEAAAVIDFPYPVETWWPTVSSTRTWWPTVSSIRKERRSTGEAQDEDNFEEDPGVLDTEAPFRANISKIRERFSTEVSPGLLEKLPHCRIHRMLMKKRKNPTAPELVYCFQVTELYPNDIMVCCSHCGTWRHTGCGGHHKPYSVRECIDSPFNAVCDRCHYEEKILREHPTARKRIDRQRAEQIRRGLATSAAMRQASFSKHGGTYKWPLGSVSATHIGGHTRSVHHRHDKAEKQWGDMAQRLSRNNEKRPKERVKLRTKELERLLSSVEDAEGHTDRHNMMLFLLQDTLKEDPSGFEKRRRNIFDPEEGTTPNEAFGMVSSNDIPHTAEGDSESPEGDSESPLNEAIDSQSTPMKTAESEEDEDEAQRKDPTLCARKGCLQEQRFDSMFCSDACGVATLELDLLRTFNYTSDMHPSTLRS